MPKSVPPEPWNVSRRGLAEPVLVELGGAGAVMTAAVEAVGAADAAPAWLPVRAAPAWIADGADALPARDGLGGVGGRRIFSSAAA
jgi:hypothetical protein